MMRVSVTYLYTISRYGYPPAIDDDVKALAEIERMGFHFLEMEALGEEHGRQVWQRRSELKSALDGHGIHVHNFCIVDPKLVSLNAKVRAAAYDRFRQMAELGVFLGAETLHLASYAPPVNYEGEAPYALGGDYKFGDTFRMRLPDGFDWGAVWAALVDSCRKCAAIAAEHGRTILMEPRVGEVVCSVDSMLRLIADVGMPNFKANFDTAHFAAQRENVVLALAKLAGNYANIHISDNDPINTNHITLGEGKIDWEEFFRVLKLHGYQGYLGLDLGLTPTLAHDLKWSLAYVLEVGKRAGVEIAH